MILKIIKISLVLLSIFIGFISYLHYSKASTIVFDGSYSTTTNGETYATIGDSGMTLYQVSSSVQVNSIELWVKSGSSSITYPKFTFKECDTGTYGTNGGYTNCISKIYFEGASVQTGSDAQHIFLRSTSSYTLSPSKYYLFASDSYGQDWYVQILYASNMANTYIAGQAFGTVNQDNWFRIGYNLGIQSDPLLTFQFPENGTTTDPFDYFWITGENVTGTDIYSVHLTYHEKAVGNIGNERTEYLSNTITGYNLMQSGITFPFSWETGTNSYCFIDTPPYIDNDCPFPYDATVTLVNNTEFNGIEASTSILFWQNGEGSAETIRHIYIPTPTSTNSTSTNLLTDITIATDTTNPLNWLNGRVANLGGNSTSTDNCAKPEGITDVGGGIYYGGCKLMGLALNPDPTFFNPFKQEWNNTKTKFPFKMVFETASIVSSSLTNGTNTYGTLSFTIPSAFGSDTSTITIASANILDSTTTMPASLKTTMFDALRNIMWLSTAIGVIMIPFM